MAIKIRKITIKDRVRLSDMIKKMADNFGAQKLLNLINPEPSAGSSENTEDKKAENRMIQIGIGVVKMLIDTLENDVHIWFAELIGVSMDEFYEMPIDTETEILKQLSSAPEVERFFMTASQIFNKTKQFAGQLKGNKEK